MAAKKQTALDKQITSIAEDVRQALKLPEEKAALVQRYTKRAVNRILVFCSRQNLPLPLQDVAAQIVEDMLQYDGCTEGTDGAANGVVSSISRGDTTISYKDKRSAYTETVSFVRNYESQLVPFKRMKLPRDATAESGGGRD